VAWARPIAAFDRLVGRAVAKILSKRTLEEHKRHRNRRTLQPFLDVRIAGLDKTLGGSFGRRYLPSRRRLTIIPSLVAA
jgi:hypothetical protein